MLISGQKRHGLPDNESQQHELNDIGYTRTCISPTLLCASCVIQINRVSHVQRWRISARLFSALSKAPKNVLDYGVRDSTGNEADGRLVRVVGVVGPVGAVMAVVVVVVVVPAVVAAAIAEGYAAKVSWSQEGLPAKCDSFSRDSSTVAITIAAARPVRIGYWFCRSSLAFMHVANSVVSTWWR